MLRHRTYVPPEALSYVKEKGLFEKLDGSFAKINGVKLYADGSLGARTEALREPYSDDPRNSGLLRYSDEELADLAGRADSSDLQVIVHAIGDRAIEQAIEALSAITGKGNPKRHRIEHASLLPRDLRARIRRHSISLAVQPSFIVSDTWAEQRLGEARASDLYPFKSILSEGTVASGGSDAPVESLSPILGMWAAMVRRGEGSGEELDIGEAVALYTTNASINGLDEGATPLREGSLANVTLLDSDIRGMHPALLRKVAVAATMVGGNLAYSQFE
jgi:predicted amidohydrolase YtcJ